MQAIRCRHCLHPRPFARLLISLLLGGWLFSPVCLPGADSGYEQQLTKARALAKENSWALAREVYAAALPLAPDADHHRWCEFWLADATWRSEGQPGWAQRENWLKLHLATYDALAQPYTTGIPRDHFWMELQSSRADLREVMQIPDHWRDRAEIADYLASQPPSEEAAQGYVAFLQKTLARPAARNQNNKTILPLVPHLANGSRVGASIEDRAWCAWQAAHFMQTEEIKATELPDRLKARAERWAAVRTLAHGTRWETVVRAEDFIWRARMGWSPDAAPGTPANIPALLAGIKEIHAAFAQEEKTDQNHQFDQELSQLEKEQGEPRLNLVMDTQFLPAAPVGFAYATAGFGRLSLSLKLLDPADWSPESATYATLPNPREGTVIREWTIDFPQSAQRVWQSELVELGSSLKPGFYSLTARGEQPVSSGEIIQYHPFIVSGIRGLSVTRSNGGGELLVYSMTDGRPVTGSAAKGIATSARQKRNASWHGTTDQEGRIALPQISASDFKLVGLIGGQPLWFRSNAGNDTREDISADVFLDRPLYRPGETVHWKIIVRERGNGRFVVPTNDRPLRLSIILDDEPLLKESTLTLNAFGTAHGEIQIPETARPGRAHLILTRADDKEPTEVAVEHGLFQVDNFVPPAVVAKIELASGGASLHPGREIVVRVNVAYFSGGPVVNAPVECHFAASPSDYRNEEIEAFQAWRKTVSANPLKSTTSVSGFAEFRLQIPAEISAGNISLECEAAVLPEGARPAHASRQFTISGLGLLIDPAGWIKPRLARPGEEILFEAVVRDGTGAPAHFEGVAQLVERQWLETWLGP